MGSEAGSKVGHLPDQGGMLLLIKQVLKITANFMAPGGKEIPNKLLKEEKRLGFTLRMVCGFKMKVIFGNSTFVAEEWADFTLKMQL